MIGGMGRPAGGITGGGGKGIMPGRLTSSTIRGSLPWSNGQRSPRTQNPFSVTERETDGQLFKINVITDDRNKYLCLQHKNILLNNPE